MNWQQLKPLLYKGQEINLMIHEHPDGDALGSAIGLAIILQQLGMKPRVLKLKPIQDIYSFLPGQELVQVIPKDELSLPKDGAVIVLDCGDPDRCEYNIGKKRALVNIDHHISNPYFGILNWVDPNAAATAEVIWSILYEEGIPIPPEAATCFYTALITDTGWFHFENVTWRTMAAASDLIRQGADLKLIRQNLAESRPRNELIILREVANRLKFELNDQALFSSLPFKVLNEQDLMRTETDSALEFMRGTKGIEVAILMKENEPNMIKISIRTKNRINASELASKLGGGGHIRAAGCTFSGTLAEAESKLIDLLKTEIN